MGWFSYPKKSCLALKQGFMREIIRQPNDDFETPQNWLLVSEALPDVQEEAIRKGLRFLGGVAIRGVAEIIPEKEVGHEATLMTAVQFAALGDSNSKEFIKNNVSTDIAERIFKAGHQTRVHMNFEGGALYQKDRRLLDVHRNTLEHTVLIPEMLQRTTYEMTNVLAFEQLFSRGILETHDAVIFSPASTSMDVEQKRAYGFFLDTETCSIQRLSATGNSAVLETALVAGKRNRDSRRHDMDAINKILMSKGIEAGLEDGTEAIRHIILIPKGEASGVEDIVDWYDDAAGGTFYGQDKPRQDYQAYAEECQQRVDGFTDMVDAITNQLIEEAHTFKTPLEAILRLDKLSEQYCVRRSIEDKTIDIAVFGEKAALDIEETRFFMEIGDYARAERALENALKNSDSSSCPLFKGTSGEGPSGGGDDRSESSDASEEKWMTCPFCSAKVFGDPCAKELTCADCVALVYEGKVLSKGNGGSAKRYADRKAVWSSPEQVKFPLPFSMV